MSAASSVLNSIRQAPTAETLKAEHYISLLDDENRDENGVDDAEFLDSEAVAAASTSAPPQRLSRNPSYLQQSLKRQLTQRKYARYDKDRYQIDEEPIPPDEHPHTPTQVGDEATHTQTNYLERSRAKAKSFMRRKGTMGQRKNERDTVIDILYENQRGIFFFGIPKYSSSSLLPSDPKPWQNAHFRTSPVDIRNAQVPDPSWEWAWKSWYVDMSRDVDEEGWEYSFKFYGGFAWHGNHPWFHSFVRRRRWLRMRKRRDMQHHTKEKAHEFTPDYFTIHTGATRPATENNIRAASGERERLREKAEEDQALENREISDIPSLIHVMKRATVDRQKLVAVRKFVDTGGDELRYLADDMSVIMGLFIFQSSRRQLLADLLQRFDTAQQRHQSLGEHRHDDNDAQTKHDAATKATDSLMKAVQAADKQVKRLEYWSDIKSMSLGGQTLQRTAQSTWDTSKWQGLSPVSDQAGTSKTFSSKQMADEGAPDLHRHPEHNLRPKDSAGLRSAPNRGGEGKVVAVKHSGGKESSNDTDGYVTAAESVSEMPGNPVKSSKRKYPLSSLDGVDESEGDFADGASIQAIEPVAEPRDDSRQDPGQQDGRS